MDPLPLLSSIRSAYDDVLLAQCRSRCYTRACSTLQQRCSSLLSALSAVESRERSRDAYTPVDMDLPSQLRRLLTQMQESAKLIQLCENSQSADSAANDLSAQFGALRECLRDAAQSIGLVIDDEQLFSAQRDEDEAEQDRLTDGRSNVAQATAFSSSSIAASSPAFSSGSRFMDEPPAEPALPSNSNEAAPQNEARWGVEKPAASQVEQGELQPSNASAEPQVASSDSASMSSNSANDEPVASPASAVAASASLSPDDVAVAPAATPAPTPAPAAAAAAVAASSVDAASSSSSTSAAAPVSFVAPPPLDGSGLVVHLTQFVPCTALVDYAAAPGHDTELSFSRGDRMEIVAVYFDQDWVVGSRISTGMVGHFPSACVITDKQAEADARSIEQAKMARASQPAIEAIAAGFPDDPSINFLGANKPESFLFGAAGSVVAYDEARADLWVLSHHDRGMSVYSAFASGLSEVDSKTKPHHSIDLKDEVRSIQSVALDRRPNAPSACIWVMGLVRKGFDSVILCVELDSKGGGAVSSRIRWPNSPAPDALRQGHLALDPRTQRLFVSSDPGRLTMLSLEGAILAELVGSPSNTDLGGPAAPPLPKGVEMGNPASMVVDEARSRLFVADLSPSQILVFHSGTLQFLYSFGRSLAPEESSLRDPPAGAFTFIDQVGLTLQSRVLLIFHKQQFAAYTTEGRFLSYIDFHDDILPAAWAVDPAQQHPLAIFLTPRKAEPAAQGCCVIA